MLYNTSINNPHTITSDASKLKRSMSERKTVTHHGKNNMLEKISMFKNILVVIFLNNFQFSLSTMNENNYFHRIFHSNFQTFDILIH